MILIAILLGLIVLVFGTPVQSTKSCDISEFLKNKNKGTCPPNGNLKSSNFCKVPCEHKSDSGDITISCSSDGKTGVVRRCDDS